MDPQADHHASKEEGVLDMHSPDTDRQAGFCCRPRLHCRRFFTARIRREIAADGEMCHRSRVCLYGGGRRGIVRDPKSGHCCSDEASETLREEQHCRGGYQAAIYFWRWVHLLRKFDKERADLSRGRHGSIQSTLEDSCLCQLSCFAAVEESLKLSAFSRSNDL